MRKFKEVLEYESQVGFSVDINDFEVRVVRIVLLHLILRDTGIQVTLIPKNRRHHLVLQRIHCATFKER